MPQSKQQELADAIKANPDFELIFDSVYAGDKRDVIPYRLRSFVVNKPERKIYIYYWK